jgi:hypothetical protein
MKNKLIRKRLKAIFSRRITKEMYAEIEATFDEWMANRESKGLESDIEEFFDVMSLDIECELESWD